MNFATINLNLANIIIIIIIIIALHDKVPFSVLFYMNCHNVC